MTIDRCKIDEESAELLEALHEGGSDALLKAMRKSTVGNVGTTRSLR